jgi:hypothetical protein
LLATGLSITDPKLSSRLLGSGDRKTKVRNQRLVQSTYLAVHPNLPGPGDTKIQIFGRRVKLVGTEVPHDV